MTTNDEREALRRALDEYNAEKARAKSIPPMEAAIVLLAGQGLANAVREVLTARPTPAHVVETVEDLPIAQMYASGQVSMAVADRYGQPWVLWESEDGNICARSYLTDDEQYACEDINDLHWPLTVLTPAPAPTTEQDRGAAVERVAEALKSLASRGTPIKDFLGRVTTVIGAPTFDELARAAITAYKEGE